MAGIGFELRRAIDLDASFLVRVRAWASAGLIASGPWLITIAVLTAIQVLAPREELREQYDLFRGLVTYASAFSLIAVGLLQVPATRWLADALWRRERGALLPALAACLAVSGVLQCVIGTLFAEHLQLDPATGLGLVVLYVAYTWSWLALVWLGATRDYDQILVAYVVGSGVCIGLVLWPEVRASLEGLVGAVAAGQAVTVMLLVRAVVRGVPPSDERSFTVLRSVRTFPRLLAFGALYNIGIWSDKVTFWVMDGESVRGILLKHPLYDSCSFLAYATVVPALAINLVRIETSFYPRYRSYYDVIEQGGSLAMIQRARAAMVQTLRESAARIVRVQAWITGACILFAPELLGICGVPDGAAPTFRVLCAGAYFHVLLLLTLLTLLYFDQQRAALRCAALFCLANIALPMLSSYGRPVHFGIGYASAALCALLFGFAQLQRTLARLEYLTFTR